MSSFGIVSEGITDQVVINNILLGYFNDPDVEINPLQPLRDATDDSRQGNSGNWLKVFEYCDTDYFRSAFNSLDYVIIHIDTDICDCKGYDIPKNEDGHNLSTNEIIERVCVKLLGIIGNEFFNVHNEKIIFAISVDSIECWILPLYYRDDRKSKTVNCLNSLNVQLGKVENFTIDVNNKRSQYRYYEKISKPYRNNRILRTHFKENPSLEVFITNLNQKFPDFRIE